MDNDAFAVLRDILTATMAVFYERKSGRLWPTVPIIIQQCADPELRGLVAEAVDELNTQVTWKIVIVAETNQLNQGIQIERSTASSSAATGYSTDPTKNKVNVNLKTQQPNNNKFDFFHELLHALGFEHEQFHSRYPWDNSELPANSAKDDAKKVRAMITKQKNGEIFDELVKEYENDFAAVQYLSSRKKNLANQHLNTTFRDCDVNSILMYPKHKKILGRVFPGVMEGRATQPVGSGLLSQGDVDALRVMYHP